MRRLRIARLKLLILTAVGVLITALSFGSGFASPGVLNVSGVIDLHILERLSAGIQSAEGGGAPTDGPFTGNEPYTVQFTVCCAQDPQDGVMSFAWDFNYDGQNFVSQATGPGPVTHTYQDGPLQTQVALRVTSSSGADTLVTKDVTVVNVPPAANAGGPYAGAASSTIHFTGTSTDPSPIDQAAGFDYAWDFDYNGAFQPDLTGHDLTHSTHAYLGRGFRFAALRTTDKDGATSSIALADVTIGTPPLAEDQSLATQYNTPLPITLSGTDSQTGTLTYRIWKQPAHGVLTGTAPNVTYIPDTDFSGTDRFQFQVLNGDAASAPATVSVTVTKVNHAPAADSQSVTTQAGAPVNITLTGSDPDGDPLTFQIVNGPSHGYLSGVLPNVTYTPNAGYGSDSFIFKVSDGAVDSATATVSITVTAANQPPVANSQSVTVQQDTSEPITLTGSDPDGDALTYHVVSGPSHGTLSDTAPSLTYQPANGYTGNDSFSFKVNDGTVDSATTTVSLTIVAPSWIVASSPGDHVHQGGALTTDGTYVYALVGNNSNHLWRYSLGTDSWSRLPDAPGNVQSGAAIAHLNGALYVLAGNDSENFWRYDLGSDSWSWLSDAPSHVKDGGALAAAGTKYLYAMEGKNQSKFWRYNADTNSWSTMAGAPGPVAAGGALAYDGGHHIYALQGNGRNGFWRYDITTNTWSELADAPGNVSQGGALVYDGNGHVYAFRGGGQNTFWRYDIAANSWAAAPSAPANVAYGGSLAAVNGAIFALRGNNASDFWKFTPAS